MALNNYVLALYLSFWEKKYIFFNLTPQSLGWLLTVQQFRSTHAHLVQIYLFIYTPIFLKKYFY